MSSEEATEWVGALTLLEISGVGAMALMTYPWTFGGGAAGFVVGGIGAMAIDDSSALKEYFKRNPRWARTKRLVGSIALVSGLTAAGAVLGYQLGDKPPVRDIAKPAIGVGEVPGVDAGGDGPSGVVARPPAVPQAQATRVWHPPQGAYVEIDNVAGYSAPIRVPIDGIWSNVRTAVVTTTAMPGAGDPKCVDISMDQPAGETIRMQFNIRRDAPSTYRSEPCVLARDSVTQELPILEQ